MCDAWMKIVNETCGEVIETSREEWMEEGIKKGRELEKISLIKRLIENMKVSVDQAMNIIGISGDEKEMYSKLLRG